MKSRNELAALLRECRERVGPTAVSEVRDLIARIDAALAPEAGETVRVRAAVAIDREGSWFVYGDWRDEDKSNMEVAIRDLNRIPVTTCFVEFDATLPVSKTIEGEVASE